MSDISDIGSKSLTSTSSTYYEPELIRCRGDSDSNQRTGGIAVLRSGRSKSFDPRSGSLISVVGPELGMISTSITY
jgi:hypothetical protein